MNSEAPFKVWIFAFLILVTTSFLNTSRTVKFQMNTLMTPMNSEALADLVNDALGWASAHSLSVLLPRKSDESNDEEIWKNTHMPFSLLPNSLPKAEFEKAEELAPIYNELVDAISRDRKWLKKIHKDVLEGDPFTSKLIQIMEEMEGLPQQDLCLGLHRSDYMLHSPQNERPQLLQVEMNTVAVSLGCVSNLTSKLHQFLLKRYSDFSTNDTKREDHSVSSLIYDYLTSIGIENPCKDTLDFNLPFNSALKSIPSALAVAHQTYGIEKGFIIMVIKENELNAIDQRLIEYGLWEDHKIKMVRMTLRQIHEQCWLDQDLKMRIGSEKSASTSSIASIVYFRAGYSPDDYPTEVEWEGRKLIEKSNAIKCPNISYHLAGTKKVQQVLTEPDQLERFISPSKAEKIRSSFAGLWAGNDKNAIAEALNNPSDYVLKPQREGGGNNFFGSEMVEKIEQSSGKELSSYILMKKLLPPKQNSILLFSGKSKYGATLSEWGFYGCYLGNGKDEVPILNTYAGHLVRTKFEGINEGGVTTGYACLSSPLLVD